MTEDVKENEMQGGVPAKVRALDRDGNSIVADLQDVLNVGFDNKQTQLAVVLNHPVLLGEGVGLLMIQESWLSINVSLFYVSTDEIFPIRDKLNSLSKLSILKGKIYWTEINSVSKSLRMWFLGIKGFSYS